MASATAELVEYLARRLVEKPDDVRVEAIILSMTPRERGYPHTIDGSRRQRIARGSGTTVQEVSRLLNARKEMQKVMKQLGKGKMPALPPMR